MRAWGIDPLPSLRGQPAQQVPLRLPSVDSPVDEPIAQLRLLRRLFEQFHRFRTLYLPLLQSQAADRVLRPLRSSRFVRVDPVFECASRFSPSLCFSLSEMFRSRGQQAGSRSCRFLRGWFDLKNGEHHALPCPKAQASHASLGYGFCMLLLHSCRDERRFFSRILPSRENPAVRASRYARLRTKEVKE